LIQVYIPQDEEVDAINMMNEVKERSLTTECVIAMLVGEPFLLSIPYIFELTPYQIEKLYLGVERDKNGSVIPKYVNQFTEE
jgi:hypothetical protein